MKRRNFFNRFAVGWFVSLLPAAMSACSSQRAASSVNSDSSSLSANPPTRADGFVPVGTVTALNQTGFLKTKIAGKSVSVLRDPTHQNTLRSLNLTCTHAGCTVGWNGAAKIFECPCHDSHFAADGKVLEGPAPKPLQTYPTKLEGNTILVKVN